MTDVNVPAENLEETIDYLEGLALILRNHASDEAQAGTVNSLMEVLERAAEEHLSNAWSPLRYGRTGLEDVALNVDEMRRRLQDRLESAQQK